MNSFNLTREGGTEVIACACGTCGRVWDLQSRIMAERCCDRRCATCQEPMEGSWSSCESCRGKVAAEKLAKRLAEATRVDEREYDGPVYLEDTGNEGYHDDTDAFRDWWASEHGDAAPLPAHVWACTTWPIQLPGADTIVEDACEHAYDDAYEDMPDTTDLQAAIDAYNARVTARVYEPDFARLVVLEIRDAGQGASSAPPAASEGPIFGPKRGEIWTGGATDSPASSTPAPETPT